MNLVSCDHFTFSLFENVPFFKSICRLSHFSLEFSLRRWVVLQSFIHQTKPDTSLVQHVKYEPDLMTHPREKRGVKRSTNFWTPCSSSVRRRSPCFVFRSARCLRAPQVEGWVISAKPRRHASWHRALPRRARAATLSRRREK